MYSRSIYSLHSLSGWCTLVVWRHCSLHVTHHVVRQHIVFDDCISCRPTVSHEPVVYCLSRISIVCSPGVPVHQSGTACTFADTLEGTVRAVVLKPVAYHGTDAGNHCTKPRLLNHCSCEVHEVCKNGQFHETAVPLVADVVTLEVCTMPTTRTLTRTLGSIPSACTAGQCGKYRQTHVSLHHGTFFQKLFILCLDAWMLGFCPHSEDSLPL